MHTNQVRIFQAHIDRDQDSVRALFWEYLEWANAKVNQEFGVNFNIKEMLAQDMQLLAKFFPPDGFLLLAECQNQVVGIACLRKISEEVGEVKRMYVRAAFRRSGIGQMLLERLIDLAHEMGFSCVRLDSARFMKAAHALYRSNGFHEIAPYSESEIPEAFQKHWLFMERAL